MVAASKRTAIDAAMAQYRVDVGREVVVARVRSKLKIDELRNF